MKELSAKIHVNKLGQLIYISDGGLTWWVNGIKIYGYFEVFLKVSEEEYECS